MKHVFVLLSLFPQTEPLGCGFQSPDPSLPGLDEVDAGDQPPAAPMPASHVKVRAPFCCEDHAGYFKKLLFQKVTATIGTWDSETPIDCIDLL